MIEEEALYFQTVLVQLRWFLSSLTVNLFLIPTVFKLVHVLSLASSSFIEEEHQTSYFIGLTTSCLIIFQLIRGQSEEKASMGSFHILVLQGFGLLGLLKVARCWNQTGDKWGHLVSIVCCQLGALKRVLTH